MRNIPTWQLLQHALENGDPATLLVVAASQGSSPGRQGFMMGVSKSGAQAGSIGGGGMEYRFVEMASKGLDAPVCLLQEHKKDSEARSGLICSGWQVNIAMPLSEADLPAIRRIIHCLESDGMAVLRLGRQGLSLHEGLCLGRSYRFDQEAWLYEEQLGFKQTLSIIGGGHVGLALSKLARELDFRVHIYDHRHNCPTMRLNTFAHRKVAVPYPKLSLPQFSNHYVVVMTFSMAHDVEALKALIYEDFSYIGLMGSSVKISEIWKQLRQAGVTENLLQRIYAPVGLPIASQTPFEIAVSVAAQIIEHKNTCHDNTVHPE